MLFSCAFMFLLIPLYAIYNIVCCFCDACVDVLPYPQCGIGTRGGQKRRLRVARHGVHPSHVPFQTMAQLSRLGIPTADTPIFTAAQDVLIIRREASAQRFFRVRYGRGGVRFGGRRSLFTSNPSRRRNIPFLVVTRRRFPEALNWREVQSALLISFSRVTAVTPEVPTKANAPLEYFRASYKWIRLPSSHAAVIPNTKPVL
mmetsp:Transcript_39678/g.40289  ORF Transcript_39678/g.40289 Transcript_39678/m.40289 type:complete len:202 (+) Transcript_39678:521-1126(+)